ncbi:thioredoxin domain-containing protein [Spiribacter sp. 221]|uniref:thioredoxin domain-containing protein n=1 Tax=Spiribacter onubensis TaxID=3122420 RepID=UPI00349F44B5
MPSPAIDTNRLEATTSPYLRQHAANPVHWQPWDDAALAAARERDCPILLSIGYSACHWCHVMAHECFEHPAIAEQMNRDFINIKVDREERPDLDRIYQTAHQLLVGRGGGWPLTVFLTPDQVPFFAGTYFPAEPREGMPGFGDVMDRIHRVWQDHRDEITEQNADLQRVMDRLSAGTAGAGLPGSDALEAARLQLGERFDPAHGGFGDAPKFPQPVALERLLRHYARSQQGGEADRGALHMACHTLRRMALGGIYDQVGGGFARYSVDGEWMIPHFEKMLSDNALLIGVASDAYRATGDRFFRRIARETAEWALREMQLPAGGFATSLDADTSAGEGAFYLWTPEEIRAVVDAEEAELVIRRLGLDEKPNFEGRWHPQVHMAFSELAKVLKTPREALVARWQSAQQKLRTARDGRERPGRDDKALTAWNALMIRGLARAGRFLDLPDLIDRAEQAEHFVREHLWRDGRLLASWRDGRADLPGYLDDHAFMLAALIELQQARWSAGRTDWAMALGDVLLEQFEDPEAGGFFFTAADHETLIQRPRAWTDDALPAGNGVAALALNRLGQWVGDRRYSTAAKRAVAAAAESIDKAPAAHCAVLDALDELLAPPEQVIIRADGATAAALREVAEAGYHPQRLIFMPGPGEMAAAAPTDGSGAWVCRGHTCLPVARTPAELSDRLAERD